MNDISAPYSLSAAEELPRSVSECINLIRNILEDRPIRLPLPYCELPTDALLYVHKQLSRTQTQMIFETAMMQVFDYYRKNEAYTAELYWLIWLFEKVPTASNPTHFEKLTDTLNQGELQDRSSRGISLHYVLLNVLFEYDNAQVFQPIFLYEVTFQTDPLFFQAALRYFSRSPEYFVRFMDRVCQRFQEPEPTIISMIAHTFNEILEVEKTKEPVTYWFKISSKGLKENKFFDRLKTETKEILDDADHPTVTRFMAVMREIEGQNRLANSRPQKAGLMLPSSDTSIRASA